MFCLSRFLFSLLSSQPPFLQPSHRCLSLAPSYHPSLLSVAWLHFRTAGSHFLVGLRSLRLCHQPESAPFHLNPLPWLLHSFLPPSISLGIQPRWTPSDCWLHLDRTSHRLRHGPLFGPPPQQLHQAPLFLKLYLCPRLLQL